MIGRLEFFPRRANPEPARPGRAPRLALAATLLLLPGCGALRSVGDTVGGQGPQAGEQGFVRGFLGGVAAEEPRAALVARNVLSAGGSAADAAVAAGFTMAVTLPSRAGLGGGGACLVLNPRRGDVEAVVFPPGNRVAVPGTADRPAAVPMLARGLFALHARSGRRPFEELISPAEQAARLGTEVSRALATDLAAVAAPLLADPWAAAVFAGPSGAPLATGERLVQADLGATLGTLRTAGVGDLYQGALARRLEEASAPAGGGLAAGEMRTGLPRVVAPIQLRAGSDLISFLPPPADGGLAAAASFAALQAGAAPAAAAARGVAVARAWRERGGDPATLVAADVPADGVWPTLPASAGLAVIDREGMAVSCAFTMNNLFGTGRVAPGTGILLAAAPGIGAVQPPLLSAAIAHNANIRAFRAAVAGSGQHMAAMAVALPLAQALRGADAPAAAASAPEPGRAQVLTCLNYLPGRPETCTGATDPRGAGLALGAVDR
jgi:gamma-glutamyltranspeptidase/glutathione hydrolase